MGLDYLAVLNVHVVARGVAQPRRGGIGRPEPSQALVREIPLETAGHAISHDPGIGHSLGIDDQPPPRRLDPALQRDRVPDSNVAWPKAALPSRRRCGHTRKAGHLVSAGSWG